ncbi:MAG: hypothetical protein B0W54_17865 [Cellvibrio sp. 79]|nr:MAG: hypothetical protein B0W54_17865 [Cellvibrio sp. 79]
MIDPEASQERALPLDVLRGVAVLGILLINLYSFALPSDMRANPLQLDNPSVLDTFFWYFLSIFIDGKCIALLSLCFGASMEYFARRHQQSELQERRLWWLAVIGSVHGYLLWSGDILFTYAVMGWVAWQWRRLDQRQLLVAGAALIFMQSLTLLMFAILPESFHKEWAVYATPAEISKEIALYRQSWTEQFPARAAEFFGLQMMVVITGWPNLGLMLVGMAMARQGWFSVGISRPIGNLLTGLTLGTGFCLVATSVFIGWAKNFPATYVYMSGAAMHLLGSMLMAIGYAIVGVRYCQSDSFVLLRKLVTPIGKMAMSFYVLQTLVCTFIFYGFGAGLFAHFALSQLMLFAVIFWLAQILLAHCWLRYFYMGPLEYLWRCLAYRESLPWRRT